MIQDEDTPVWSEVLDFGISTWRQLTVQVFDEDGVVDDPLTKRHWYALQNGDVQGSEVICTDMGCPPTEFAAFEYESNDFP